ncbi:MAG: ATP-binding protein, partial [Patescibacteria group bacterium]|nr:ATP-binding protein [Patescibacteria group bacterium]
MADQISQNIGSGKILLIFGPRQAGKTTLAKKLLAEHGDPSAYFNCEEMSVREHLVVGVAGRLKELVGDHKLVVLDEAQTVENIGVILKLFVDTYPDVQIIATGSSSFDLANKINEPLTGRAFSFTLLPLSLEEIRSVKPIDGVELQDLMRFGSYPAIVAAQTRAEKERILKNITTSYLYKDIFTFEKIKSPLHFELLLKLLAHQVGSTVSLNEIAESLAVSRHTVEKYLRLLEQAYVIRRVHSFSRNSRNEIRKSFKVFFLDAGVRNAIINDLRDTDTRTDVGSLFELLFFTELMKQSTLETFGPDIQFWRTKQGLEIDFIVERAGNLRAYECKWGGGEVSFKTFIKLYPEA